MNVTRGFSLDTTSKITGVQRDRLRYWAKHDVLRPSLVYEPGVRYGYLYSFQDLVSLKTLKSLRDRYGFPLQQLRPIGKRLREFYDQPWSTLRFFVAGEQLAFSDREREQLISASKFGQAMLDEVTIDLEEVSKQVSREADRLRERSPKDIGSVTRKRLIFQNKPVIAGTRIPVTLIQQYVAEGYSVAEILSTYPFLQEEDIAAALNWNCEQEALSS